MKRSKFSLSNTKLLSCDMGELIPCGMFEVLPGDSIQQSTNLLVRASPLLAPVMHPVDVRIHHWYVPYRIIWSNFEDFITGGPDGMDATVYPTWDAQSGGSTVVGSLPDYLGVPLAGGGGAALPVSALPLRAYALIWNEFYRDQDLETALTVNLGDGNDATTNKLLQHVNWEKDYFTSARPWEQKGPAITIPLGTTAPVEAKTTSTTDQMFLRRVDNNALAGTAATLQNTSGGILESTSGGVDLYVDPGNRLQADLSTASSITINLLREALALQRFEEARARFGSRYVEYLRYLGVRSSDARLQRPEYLGGGRQTISWSEVLQTAEGTDPVGSLKGHGIAGVRSNRYRRYFEEHGLVMSLLSVRPKTIYMQGLSRMWTRTAKEDFWQKELEGIGQQAILNKEVYADHADINGTFGYQDRYDEYRRQESSVAGEFRTSTLNHWHMAREFSSSPALNASFVKAVPTERTFAVPSEDVLYIYARHSIQARRLVAQTGKSFIY